ncbi:MAG: Integration host factor subunit beta [Alphaproteobacteria bacterium MarineAlpha6_Bin4]|nr:MAG: Integration host factor subunit beta [Alphaproteobacteria bacterium MarineAlpha6_Bin5]PPR37307.1 MAG: Integration host factor subunit beta [Alphaproteobacteria bacterium MarineAlpha6_Bin4]|tara:strand:+ start:3357 stop:3638 length:282 start_codon:yes stop_codon:yes gene_type:complete
MNKSDIVKSLLSKNNKYTVSEIENIVEIFFNEIEKSLSEEKRIELRGFGSFFTKVREKRIGINPQNGKNIEIDKKIHPKFKMGKILFKKLNPK